MQVVTLFGSVDYEGRTLLGVYSERRRAIEALKQFVQYEPEHCYDQFVLEYRDLDSDAGTISDDIFHHEYLAN